MDRVRQGSAQILAARSRARSSERSRQLFGGVAYFRQSHSCGTGSFRSIMLTCRRSLVACVVAALITASSTAFNPDDACCADVTLSNTAGSVIETMDIGCNGDSSVVGRLKFDFKLKTGDHTVTIKAYSCNNGVVNKSDVVLRGSCTMNVGSGTSELCTMYYTNQGSENGFLKVKTTKKRRVGRWN